MNLTQRSLARLRRGERGQALVFVAASLAALFGLTAFAIDVSYTLQTRREVQASTDAAALAGAQELPDATKAVAMARSYSGIAGSKNARTGHVPVTMVSGYPMTKCLNSIGIPCNPANAIVVQQQAAVPTFFAKILGRTSLTVRTTATASMKGGTPQLMDIVIVLDTTASMNDPCSGSVPGASNPTRLDCALAGVRALIGSLWPCAPSKAQCGAVTNGNVQDPVDRVALMIFPGLKQTSSVAKELDCNNNLTSSDIQAYNKSPIYTIVGLSSDYRVSTKHNLNGQSSNLVKAVDWKNGNTCGSQTYGVESPGGVGTYFADVIKQAQDYLAANGRQNVQKAIIFLSDGDSSYTGVSDPCATAVTRAKAAAAAGTWIYSIAYGASKSTSSSCTEDSPKTSAYVTMQKIASDGAKFFDQPSAGDLTDIFEHILIDLTNSRLVPDSTT